MRPRNIDRKYVIAAIKKFESLDKGALNDKHGTAESARYPLIWEGKEYPSKTILNEAIELHNLENPDDPVEGVFRGGFKASNGMSRVLSQIGFDILDKQTGAMVATGNTAEGNIAGSEDMCEQRPLNQIFYGPPGTGKTYRTVKSAVDIVDPSFSVKNNSREAIKAKFDHLVSRGDIQFVTFHQSFSYEDFVEGIRAEADDEGRINYVVADGVFKKICESASVKITQNQDNDVDVKGRRVWKMSLGNATGSDSYIFEECLTRNVALLGYGSRLDFSGCKTRDDVVGVFRKNGNNVEAESYAVTAVTAFVCSMKVGDLIVVSEGNLKLRAIGQVTGDYEVANRTDALDDYQQSRSIKWLRTYKPALPSDRLLNGQFSQRTLYELRAPLLRTDSLQDLLSADHAAALGHEGYLLPGQAVGGYKVLKSSQDVLKLLKPGPGNKILELGGELIEALVRHVRKGDITVEDIKNRQAMSKLSGSPLDPYIVNGYSNVLAPLIDVLASAGGESGGKRPTAPSGSKVLIIDEINRGNISRIFGELISLLEPSKRVGAGDSLEVVLPYSKKPFCVPDNLYIIGTMNTADRSLTAMDVALRRRFSFIEVLPDAELLSEVFIEGLSLRALLEIMNKRIEVLLGRDHCLGHAYFLPLEENPTLEGLSTVFRDQILPLLQEYFFDDWRKISLVLNDHRKGDADKFLREEESRADLLFGSDIDIAGIQSRWVINVEAFERIEAYRGILSVEANPVSALETRSATHQGYRIRELESGSIELWDGDRQVLPVLPLLRQIAEELGLGLNYNSGAALNTRQLGVRVLAALQDTITP